MVKKNYLSKVVENVYQIFKRLKEEQGLLLLIVTHYFDFAKRTDRIIEMEDGRLVTPVS